MGENTMKSGEKFVKVKMKLKTETTFDAAHRLVGYNGKCSNLHGHTWRVVVWIEGDKLDERGIMWDFTNLKTIKELLDHKVILKNCAENRRLIKTIMETCGEDSVVLLSENPTAEYLATFIFKLLWDAYPHVEFKVRVYESPKSYAEI